MEVGNKPHAKTNNRYARHLHITPSISDTDMQSCTSGLDSDMHAQTIHAHKTYMCPIHAHIQIHIRTHYIPAADENALYEPIGNRLDSEC